MTRQLLFNPNLKNVSIAEVDEFLEWKSNQAGGETDANAAYRAVPWLFRGVTLRAQGVASMPFIVENANGKEIDNSDKYQNAVEFLPKPKALLYLIEASLTLTGCAYAFQEKNRIALKNLRYLVPSTIKPKITEAGLQYFERNINGRKLQIPVEQMLYLWLADPQVELGPPKAYPASAALAAAGVMLNMDQFVTLFFARGAIKATLLTVAGNPPQPEKDRIKAMWEKVMSGIGNAWSTFVANADALKPVVVGEGLKELENQALSDEKRRDIAAALMIPQTKLFSGDASGIGGGGVVSQDDINFANEFRVPECEAIQEALNEQVFEPNGYTLKFTPENLDVFHDDEAALAATANTYLDMLQKCRTKEEWEAVTAMSGVEYDPVLIDKVFAAKDLRREETQAQLAANGNGNGTAPANLTITKPEPKLLPSGDPNEAAKALEKRQFKAWAKNGGKGEFVFHYLTDAEQAEAQAGVPATPFQEYRERHESLSAGRA